MCSDQPQLWVKFVFVICWFVLLTSCIFSTYLPSIDIIRFPVGADKVVKMYNPSKCDQLLRRHCQATHQLRLLSLTHTRTQTLETHCEVNLDKHGGTSHGGLELWKSNVSLCFLQTSSLIYFWRLVYTQ